MVWNGFSTIKEQKKVIFCFLHFPYLCSMGVETVKKINFAKKKIEKFEIVTWSELSFAL